MKIKTIRNKKAVSAVVSNMILVAAVIAVGFSVLIWTQFQAGSYQSAQALNIYNDINKLEEKINLEHAFYSAGNISVYIINSGPVNVTIEKVFLCSIGSTPAPIEFTLYTISNPKTIIQSNMLNATSQMREGNIEISTAMVSGQGYTVKIVTARGSEFAYTVVA